jgi:hypothetical protein
VTSVLPSARQIAGNAAACLFRLEQPPSTALVSRKSYSHAQAFPLRPSLRLFPGRLVSSRTWPRPSLARRDANLSSVPCRRYLSPSTALDCSQKTIRLPSQTSRMAPVIPETAFHQTGRLLGSDDRDARATDHMPTHSLSLSLQSSASILSPSSSSSRPTRFTSSSLLPSPRPSSSTPSTGPSYLRSRSYASLA